MGLLREHWPGRWEEGLHKDQDWGSRESSPQGTPTDGLGMASSHGHRVEKAEAAGSVLLCMVPWGAHHSDTIQNLGEEWEEDWTTALTHALPIHLFPLSHPLHQSTSDQGTSLSPLSSGPAQLSGAWKVANQSFLP